MLLLLLLLVDVLLVVGVDGETGVFGCSGGGATIGIAFDMRTGAVGLDMAGLTKSSMRSFLPRIALQYTVLTRSALVYPLEHWVVYSPAVVLLAHALLLHR